MKRFYILFAFLVIIGAGLTVAAQSQPPPFVPSPTKCCGSRIRPTG